MATFSLILFSLSSLIHLYASYVDNKQLRAASKSPILVFLILYYLFSVPTVDRVFAAALVFCLLGDILLIFKKGFVFGGISFMAGHACLMLTYAKNIDFAKIPLLLYALPAAVYGMIVYTEFKGLKKYIKKPMFAPMVFYLCVNAAMNLFALWQHALKPSVPTMLIYIGAVLFFASDCVLFVARFRKDKPVWRNHFPVMLTYIGAVLLITLGVLA